MIKITIVIVSYNQANYIRNAIEGVVSQKLNYDIELIIADDCSTDNTNLICKEYQEKYSFVKYEPSNHNLGYSKNWQRALTLGSGEYLAVFEADDYWNNEDKLQKQIEYLDLHKDWGLCYTDFDIYNVETDKYLRNNIKESRCIISDENPVFGKGYQGNVTWVFRRDAIKDIQIPSDCVDVPLLLLYEVSLGSKIGYVDVNTGVWRKHLGSYSNQIATAKQYLFRKQDFLLKESYYNRFPYKTSDFVSLVMRTIIDLYELAGDCGDCEFQEKLDNYLRSFGSYDYICYLRTKQNEYKSSYAYRIGKFLLSPLRFIHSKLKK